MTPTTDAEGLIDHPPKRLAPRAQPTFNFRNPKRDTSISQSQSIRAPPSRRFLHNKRRPLSGPTPRLGMPRFKKSLEHVPILQSQQSRRHRVLPLQIRTSSSRAMNMAKNLVVVVAFADGTSMQCACPSTALPLICPFSCPPHFAFFLLCFSSIHLWLPGSGNEVRRG